MLRVRLLLLLGLLVAAPSTTHAASIAIQSVGFDGAFDSLSVRRFDPELGTLDSVGVTITGVLSASGLAPQVPGNVVPSFFAVSVQQTFVGVGGGFFDFGSPATFLLNGSSLGEPFTLNATFTYSFRFTSLSDLVGFVIPSASGPTVPPVTVNGRRADFVGDPAVPGFINLTHVSAVLPITGLPPVLTSTNSQGVIFLEYRYTPAVTPSVPEPAIALLVPVGLGVVAWRRRATRSVH
jgi:hypothetical protein